MELKIDRAKDAKLLVKFEDECLDFCCLHDDGQQYDFVISESEWQTLKMFVDAQIQEWAESPR